MPHFIERVQNSFTTMAVVFLAIIALAQFTSTGAQSTSDTSTIHADEASTAVSYPVHSSVTGPPGYNFSCYSCFGIVGEVTQCGESLTAEEDIAAADRVPCNTVCTKAVSYQIDMKIYVRRNCSASCDPGCQVRGGTGTCWYCCHGNLCNGADAIHGTVITLLFIWIVGVHFQCVV